MTAGIAQFEINNLHNDPTSPRLWWAEVSMNFDDVIEDIEVTHWATIKVRVTADETVTVQELREILLQKARETISRASQHVEGKSAQELLHAAHLRNDQEMALLS